jgi:hemoglobin
VIDDQQLYSDVGGDGPFFALVERFYEGVAERPELRRLYPDDLEPGKKHLAWFLIQRFGGPQLFSEKRGAPMLRRRHVSFEISITARDGWFECMMAAVDLVPELAPYRELLSTYFSDAATFLINRSEPKGGGSVLPQV